MKKCSVRLERMSDATIDIYPPKPTVEKHSASPKPADKNVYDYSFDLDATPLDSGGEMQDLFAKLAKENRIEVKKYKPKAVRQAKKKVDNASKSKTVRKRRHVAPAGAEPSAKKPNPNVGENVVHIRSAPREAVQVDANRNKIAGNKVVMMDSPGIDRPPRPQPLGISNILRSAHNIERLRKLTNFQPTMKQSTPLKATQILGSTKGIVESNTLLKRLPGSVSPATALNSPIVSNIATSAVRASPLASRNNEYADRSVFAVDDFDSMDFMDPEPEPEPVPSTSGFNKENSLSVSSKSIQGDRQSRIATPLNDSSSFNIFSPTKRRVYGRSPLKNIVSPNGSSFVHCTICRTSY